ncbi:MAG: cation transporter [Flavobacteriaceae bacterium]|nr:cation transporter [Flavobacteriaceae bacterium]
MKHTYSISGMTCGGCVATVEKELGAVQGVTEVQVSLEKNEAEVSMSKHIDVERFQNALSSKYQITEKKERNVFSSASQTLQEEEKSKLQQLTPLFLILGYITAASVLLNYQNWNLGEAMFDFMGLFYIVFSFFKLLDLKGFPDSFKMYDPLAKVFPAYGWIYPFIETALGLMFLMRFQTDIALLATIVVLGITTIGVTRTLLSKKTIQCACLGTALKLPMTQATFIENAIMLVMAFWMLLSPLL